MKGENIHIMIDPPASVPVGLFTVGSARVATGAALFAATNAAATALYRKNGASVVSLYVLRSPIVFFANCVIVAYQEGGEAARSVFLLRTGSSTASKLALARSCSIA